MAELQGVLVDEYLIHGEVTSLWAFAYDCDFIIVANDLLCEDKMRQGILDMSVSNDLVVVYYSIEMTKKKLAKLSQSKRIILIVENLVDAHRLHQAGIQLNQLTLIAVAGESAGRRLTPEVCLFQSDWQLLQDFDQAGIKIEVQHTPQDRPVNVNKLLAERDS